MFYCAHVTKAKEKDARGRRARAGHLDMNMKVNKRVYVACFCSGTYHNDTEPAHLRIKPELEHIPESVSYQEYAAPE